MDEIAILYGTMSCRLTEVRWHNQSIIVLNEVTIVPPYTVDDCSATDPNSHALQHVRKLVIICTCCYHRCI